MVGTCCIKENGILIFLSTRKQLIDFKFILADFFVEVEPGGTLFIVAVVSASAHAVSRIPIPLVIGQFQSQMEIAIKLY